MAFFIQLLQDTGQPQSWLRFQGQQAASQGQGQGSPEAGDQCLEVMADHALPGLEDLQINGAGGVLFSTVTEVEQVHKALAAIAATGTSACLPTLFTHPLEQLETALQVLGKALGSALPPECAFPIGLHLEGPFLNPQKAGCHPPQHMIHPSIDLLERWQGLSRGAIRLLTLAPELPGATDLISWARSQGIAVSLGHTTASYAQCQEAADAGATFITHLFNAMSPLSAREPGPIGAGLNLPNLRPMVIADGVHVAPENLVLLLKARSPNFLVLVSDAMPPLGTAATSFKLLGQTITVQDGICRGENGVLAGSSRPLWWGVAHLARISGLPLSIVNKMANNNLNRQISENSSTTVTSSDAPNLIFWGNDLKPKGFLHQGKFLQAPVIC